jgi:hypothetical protein
MKNLKGLLFAGLLVLPGLVKADDMKPAGEAAAPTTPVATTPAETPKTAPAKPAVATKKKMMKKKAASTPAEKK